MPPSTLCVPYYPLKCSSFLHASSKGIARYENANAFKQAYRNKKYRKVQKVQKVQKAQKVQKVQKYRKQVYSCIKLHVDMEG